MNFTMRVFSKKQLYKKQYRNVVKKLMKLFYFPLWPEKWNQN